VLTNRPTIGFFHDGLSIPPKEGISVHVYELARALALHANMKIILIIADRGRATQEQLAQEPFDSILIHPDDYYDRHTITEIIKNNNIDLVQNYNTYYIASLLGPVAEACKVPLIAEHHDLESELSFLRENSTETSYHEQIQHLAIQYSARSRFMSSHDFDKIRQDLPKILLDKTFLMPVSFLPKNNTVPQAKPRDKKAVVFVGNMAYPPNRQAALMIANDIAPHLPTANFLIVGRDSKKLPVNTGAANIQLLGEVDDLYSVLGTSAIGLAPIAEGSGLKIKVITYLEAGLPVICSSIALSGYPKDDSLVQADNAAETIDQIQQLLDNDTKLSRASESAKRLFKKNFGILATLPNLTEIYLECIKTYQYSYIENNIGAPDMTQFPWHDELKNSGYLPSTQQLLIKGTI
jgi:glycosyltransferase involved in cell wall biosynthesis